MKFNMLRASSRGWHGNSWRHSLAARGIKTTYDSQPRFAFAKLDPAMPVKEKLREVMNRANQMYGEPADSGFEIIEPADGSDVDLIVEPSQAVYHEIYDPTSSTFVDNEARKAAAFNKNFDERAALRAHEQVLRDFELAAESSGYEVDRQDGKLYLKKRKGDILE